MWGQLAVLASCYEYATVRHAYSVATSVSILRTPAIPLKALQAMAPTAIETLTSFGNTAPIAAGLKVALNTTSKGQPLAAKKARPAFDALPLRPDHPYASAWGLYGDEDQLGTLNALGPELVWQGLSEVRTARVFSLALPLTVPRTPMNPARQPPKHNLICKGHANDDTVRGRSRDPLFTRTR